MNNNSMFGVKGAQVEPAGKPARSGNWLLVLVIVLTIAGVMVLGRFL